MLGILCYIQQGELGIRVIILKDVKDREEICIEKFTTNNRKCYKRGKKKRIFKDIVLFCYSFSQKKKIMIIFCYKFVSDWT